VDGIQQEMSVWIQCDLLLWKGLPGVMRVLVFQGKCRDAAPCRRDAVWVGGSWLESMGGNQQECPCC
jgi:hypothetical protein